MKLAELEHLLRESVEAAKGPNARVDVQMTESADTENVRANAIVTFPPQGNAFLSLSDLMARLEKHVTLAGVDVFGEPSRQVVLYGAAGGRNFEVVIRL